MTTATDSTKDWNDLGYPDAGETRSKEPVRWANRGPNSPRKRSHSFRAIDLKRDLPDLVNGSVESIGNKSADTEALTEDQHEENSIADGLDDEDFVVYESDEDETTEFLPSESCAEEDPAFPNEARLQVKKLPPSLADEDEEKKIVWEKPAWTKPNLKSTGKADKLKSSGDIKEEKNIEWEKPEWTKLNGSLRKVTLDDNCST